MPSFISSAFDVIISDGSYSNDTYRRQSTEDLTFTGSYNNYIYKFSGVYSDIGKINRCASFYGVEGGGDRNSRLYNDSFGIDVNETGWSFSCWIKPRSFNSYQHIIGAPFGNGFFIGGNNDALTFNLFNGTAWGIQAPTTDLDTWHHYVMTRSGNFLNLYADGQDQGSIDLDIETFDNSPKFSVGGGEFNEYFFNGDFDEMGYWKRVLTSSEIDQLYNSGNAVNYINSPTGAFSYWSFDEKDGMRYDSTENGNHLYETPETKWRIYDPNYIDNNNETYGSLNLTEWTSIDNGAPPIGQPPTGQIDSTWKGGSVFVLKIASLINRISGSEYDFINIDGPLNINATQNNKFIIYIQPVSVNDNPTYDIEGFSSDASYLDLPILFASSGISGFDPNYVDIVWGG
jgi:hypothetical protein